MQNNTAIATIENRNEVSLFEVGGDFEKALRVAKIMASSSMVPDQYRGEKGIPNVLVAMELAARMNISPFMVLQNLYIIQGRPSWGSAFLLALIKQSGRFEELRFELNGEGDNRGCSVWTIVRSTGERVEGPRIDLAMARAEGWLTKTGSKWKSMPDIMLRYRAASFFARLHAYDLVCGLYTTDEVIDIDATEGPSGGGASLASELLAEGKKDAEEAVILEYSPVEISSPENEKSPPQETIEVEVIPSKEEKSDVWKQYLDLLGQKNHAVNATLKLTDGRTYREWTASDLEVLRKDLKTRKAEADAKKAKNDAPLDAAADGDEFNFAKTDEEKSDDESSDLPF